MRAAPVRVLGAGVGALVRNTGGAVTGAILLLVILPPLAVQMVSETASWVPGTLANVVSGVTDVVAVGAFPLASATMKELGVMRAWMKARLSRVPSSLASY